MVGRIPTAFRSAAKPSVEKISLALPPEMVAQLRQAVATGEYAASSEVVRDALRDWNQKRKLQQNGIAELRQLWQEARADENTGLDPDEVFDDLERKYQALARAAGDWSNALHSLCDCSTRSSRDHRMDRPPSQP